jgi:hypothetical protein
VQEYTFIIYYIFLVLGLVIGISRYKELDAAMRIVVLWLFAIAVGELITYLLLKTEQHQIKYVVFHCSSILEIILISTYFFTLLNLSQRLLLMLINGSLWLVLGLLNILFLQPVTEINTNMLMLESFSIITMSLYFIYRMLKNDAVINIFHNPHFWLWVLWLILWSTTFFFWAFIRILYRNHWSHVQIVLNMHSVINLVIYAGITAVLFFYPKKQNSLDYA